MIACSSGGAWHRTAASSSLHRCSADCPDRIRVDTSPTGTVYTCEKLEALVAAVARQDLLVLADEVCEFVLFDDQRHISFASLPGMRERTVTVSAVTRAYAMDG